MIKPHTVSRYLERHAEPLLSGPWPNARLREIGYQNALIVPIFDEEPDCLERLFRRIVADVTPHLAICVVNQPPTLAPRSVENNQAFLRRVKERAARCTVLWPDHVWLLEAPWAPTPRLSTVDVLLIDATFGPLALGEKEGVGRARKMGADCALGLWAQGTIRGAMLGCTDADAELPPHYFHTLSRWGASPNEHEVAALLFPYVHVADVDTDVHLARAMLEIEATFRHYVLGLNHAGSPYAHHSLGSAMAFSLPHYAAVRGFPNRQAGEDFYLLSKLAQLGPITKVGGEPVRIRTRLSARVPFGTGPRLAHWMTQQRSAQAGLHIPTWHPQLFVALRDVLSQLLDWAIAGQASPKALPEWTCAEAHELFLRMAGSLKGCPSAQHRVWRVHEQFDALSTLRWLNQQRRERFPDLPLDRALDAPWLPPRSGGNARWNVEQALGQLREAEQQLPSQVGPRSARYG